MTKHILSILLFLLPLVTLAQTKFTAVSFNRTACFGKCPAYRLMVTSKGEVYYDGFQNTKLLGYHTAQVNPKKVQAIFAKYRNKKILSLPDKYNNKISDISQLHMNFQFLSKVKTIRHAHMGPVYLQQLAKDLDKLIATEKINWIDGDPDNIVDISNEEVMPIDANSPKQEITEASPKEIFLFVEQMPEFPGGEAAMMSFIQTHIKYPDEATAQGIEGKVYCSYIVNETGKVESVTVTRGVHPLLDNEAKRVIESMPLWKPGKQNGKSVAVKMTLPVTFVYK